MKKILIIFIILLCFIGYQKPAEAQRVGRMGVLVVDPTGDEQFVQSLDFHNTTISVGDAADATIDLGVITISGPTVVGLDIDGAAAQSANFVDIDDVTGDPIFTIDATGNVGIGTAAPEQLAHLYSVDLNVKIKIETGDDTQSVGFWLKEPSQEWQFSTTATGGNFVIRDQTGGNNIMTIESGGSENSLYIDNGGNVGIGTTTPGVSLEVDGLIRSTSSKWYACKYVNIYSADPGASGATRVAPSSDTLGGWNLDADGETLEFPFHICSDWDATSDAYIRIEYEVDDATATGNAVFDAIVYLKGTGEYVTKSQNLTFTQDVSGDDQYTLRHNDLIIDYDDATDGLSVGDHISVVLNFDATSSDITDVIFVGGTMRYQTNKLRVEIP